MKKQDMPNPSPVTGDPSKTPQHSAYGPHPYYAASPYYGGDGGMDESDGLDLQRILRFLLRRWKTVLLVAVAAFVLGLLYLQLATKLYRAQADLEMSVRRPKVVSSQAVYDDTSALRDTDVIINTRFAKFRSPAMEDLVVQNYMQKYPRDAVTEKKLRETIREFVTWGKERDANIVRVSVVSPDPGFAARLANILSVSAGELMVRENQAQSDEAVKWLSDQVAERRGDLDKVETELGRVRQEAQLDALAQRKEALGASLIALSAERSVQQSRLSKVQTQLNFIETLKESTPDMETLPEGLPRQELLSRMIGAWRVADEALREAAGRFTEQHPDYQTAEKKLQAARDQLTRFAGTLIQTLENQIELFERQKNQVESRIQQAEKESLVLEQKLLQGDQRMARLERNHDAATVAYDALLRRMEEARMAADETTAYTKVIRPAVIPDRPVSPSVVKVLALVLFLGLAGGAGLACVMEFWADEISAIQELEAVGLNIIGVVPSQKDVETREDLAAIGLKDKFSHVFELFAGFTAMLTSNRFRDQTRVLLINSAMPGEGKTICACNLAVSAALNGSKTLLIDCDMRRPRLAKIFKISEDHPSLLEWLHDDKNEMEYPQLVNRGVHENLDLITSRHLDGVNPAELMGRGQVAELIQWAREHYDRVIIDSPPFGLAGDVQTLANEVDSVLLVSRIGLTRRGALKHAVKRFEEMEVNVLGVIANDVALNFSGKLTGSYKYSQYASYGKY